MIWTWLSFVHQFPFRHWYSSLPMRPLLRCRAISSLAATFGVGCSANFFSRYLSSSAEKRLTCLASSSWGPRFLAAEDEIGWGGAAPSAVAAPEGGGRREGGRRSW